VKDKFIQAHMKAAEVYASLSSAQRLKVGAVVVKDNRIISIGYNGTPSGWDNGCEDENGQTKKEVIHAEANAILKLAASSESGQDAALFITHAPCMDCAKLIYGAGIRNVFYRQQYRNTEGEDFLSRCGVSVRKVP
jgi:dCMP deaminase